MTSPLDGKVSNFGVSVDTLEEFLSGAPGEIDVGGGSVPTLRKLVVDIKDAALGAVDQQIGDLREAVDEVQQASAAVELAASNAANAADVAEGIANMWPSEALGIANTADTRFFSMPSPVAGEAAIVRQRTGATSVEKFRTPSNDAVKKPVWTGVPNGWPDTFFTHSTPGVDFFGKKRWHSSNTAVPTLSVVPGSVFLSGKALQRTVQGNAVLEGPCIQVSDLGITPGVDKITVFGLFTGTGGAVISMPVRPYNGNVGTDVQAPGKSDTGATTIVGSAVGQRMRATIDVPAGTTHVWVYPYHVTAGGALKFEALWAFKGDENQGPDWPTAESIFERLQMNATAGDVAAQARTLGVVQGATEYGFDNKVVVTGSIAVAQGVTSPSSVARDLAFRGWGETISAPGVPFNAIRIKMVTRYALVAEAGKWSAINGLVRVGPTPHLAGTPIEAVGSTRVLPRDDTLIDLIILLRDPVTGALKTVNPTNNVFLSAWAQNAAGGPAALGEPRATMPNTLGQSYYTVATGNPEALTWSPFEPANARMGFELLNITDPVEGAEFFPSQKLADSLSGLAPMVAPEVIMPPYIYGVQGRECNLYLDNLHVDDADSWLHDVNTSPANGQQLGDCWRWVPAGSLAAGTLTLTTHDKRTGTKVGSTLTAQIRAAAASAGAGQNQKLLFLGDSRWASGVPTQTLLENSVGDPLAITLYGTKGSGANKHEARSGWRIADYVGPGPTYRSFGVNNVNIPPGQNATQYTDGATVYTVQDISLTGAPGSLAGALVFSVDSGPSTPPASGTLTKTGNLERPGDATINFTSTTTLPGNPLWIGGAVNVGQYLTNNGFPKMNRIGMSIGTNDGFASTTDAQAIAVADAAFTNLDIIIASALASDPGTAFDIIMPPPPARYQDAFGVSYGVGQPRWRFKRNITLWNKRLIEKYAGKEANRIFIVPGGPSIDTVNNVPYGDLLPANSRSPISIKRQGNGVHQATGGYQQDGDAYFAFLKCKV
ncbi:hypothetical protein [Variovorax boronicumulans]